MSYNYKIKNRENPTDVKGEAKDIKKIQKKLGLSKSLSEMIVKWFIYLLIVSTLAWIVFKVPILK